MISVYVDDQLSAGDTTFDNETKVTERKLQSRPGQYDQLSFFGVEISQQADGSVFMHQRANAERIKILPKSCNFAEFRSRRLKFAFLGHTRPDVTAVANMASQITSTNFVHKHVKLLNDCIKNVHKTPNRGLLQQNIHLDTTQMVCYHDSSFTNNPEDSNQLGYCVLLVDNTARTSWIHLCSYKSKRVVRSVLGGETYEFADAFDAAYTPPHDISKLLKRPLELTILTESISLLKVLINGSTTTEKFLMVDIRASFEAYEKFEIRHIGWVKSEDNLAGGLTNPGKCRALEEVLTTGSLK